MSHNLIDIPVALSYNDGSKSIGNMLERLLACKFLLDSWLIFEILVIIN